MIFIDICQDNHLRSAQCRNPSQKQQNKDQIARNQSDGPHLTLKKINFGDLLK